MYGWEWRDFACSFFFVFLWPFAAHKSPPFPHSPCSPSATAMQRFARATHTIARAVSSTINIANDGGGRMDGGWDGSRRRTIVARCIGSASPSNLLSLSCFFSFFFSDSHHLHQENGRRSHYYHPRRWSVVPQEGTGEKRDKRQRGGEAESIRSASSRANFGRPRPHFCLFTPSHPTVSFPHLCACGGDLANVSLSRP